MAQSFTEPDDELRYVVPTINPKDFYDFSVFRETFLCHVNHVKDVSAFRNFAEVLMTMSSETVRIWRGTYAEATAQGLQATVADLRFLQGYLQLRGSTEDVDEESLTPRNEHYYRVAVRLASKLGALIDETEADLRAGLDEVDE